MDHLDELLQKRLNQHKLGKAAQAAHLVHLANQFLHQEKKFDPQEVQALSVQDGILKIGTVSSVLSQEIWASHTQLIHKLQGQYGEKSVLKIRLTGLSSL